MRPVATLVAGSFEEQLHAHQHQRQQQLASSSAVPPMPRGFRAEDHVGGGDQGFLTPREAGEIMGLSEDEAWEWAARGWLEVSGGRIRPAVVNVGGA